MVSNYLAVVAINVVGTCVLVGDGIKKLKPWLCATASAKQGSSNPPLVMLYHVFVLLWFVVVPINVIGIAWDVVECEVNLAFWHERKQGESYFFGTRSALGNLVLLVISSLRNLVFLVNFSQRGASWSATLSRTILHKLEDCMQSMVFGCALYSQPCSLCSWVSGILLYEHDFLTLSAPPLPKQMSL